MFGAVKKLIDGLLSIFQTRGGSTPEERRRLIRVRCDYQVSCIVGNRTFAARVLDMGLNGMRLEVPERLRGGSARNGYGLLAGTKYQSSSRGCLRNPTRAL